MQTPESQEQKASCDYIAKDLRFPSKEENTDANKEECEDPANRGIRALRCSVIVSTSPNNELSEESTWNDPLNLPVNSLEQLEETLKIPGYEFVGREEEHGFELEGNSPVFVNEEIPKTQDQEIKEQKRWTSTSKRNTERKHIDLSAYDECLNWPILQQETTSFNELSDVLLDTYRLNKETAFLLEMIDEGAISHTTRVFVENEHMNMNNSHFQNIHNETVDGTVQMNDDDAITDIAMNSNADTLNPFASNPVFRVESTTGSQASNTAKDLDSFQRMIRMDDISYFHAPVSNNSSYENLLYEAKAEKQFKRKEKNRECSRMFRYKQRMKEDALKKGKIEKELQIRNLSHEKERIRNALAELAKHCGSCDTAMAFLSEFKDHNGKENMPMYMSQTYQQQKPKSEIAPLNVVN